MDENYSHSKGSALVSFSTEVIAMLIKLVTGIDSAKALGNKNVWRRIFFHTIWMEKKE